MRFIIFFNILISLLAQAGLPPTTSKISSDSTNVTTFNYQFPNFGGTHTGTTVSLGVNGIAGGGTGQATANAAFNALAPNQSGNSGLFLTTNGTDTSWGTVPSSTIPTASSTTLVTTTSASTTFVTGITATITVTATSAPIRAVCILDLTSATAASVATTRVTINAVAGGSVTESLTTATTQHLTIANQYLSASLGPGTYTVNCDFNRASGTGTVTLGQGSLNVVVLQGGNSNGITQLTGALTAGPGSGSQVLSGVLPVANGGTHLSSTTINQLLYSSANNVIAGLATANTGALVTSSTGVPSITSGATANRLLRTNGTTVSFAQANLTTDVTGTLPFANGGTGVTSLASGRVIYSNGATLATDGNFLFDAANLRFTVGTGGGTGKINGVVPSGSDLGGQFYCEGTNNCMQIRNNAAYNLAMLHANNANTLGVLVGAERSRGTQTSRTQALSDDIALNLVSSCYTGAASSTGFSSIIQTRLTENCTASTNGGEIVFYTTPNTTTTAIERFRITQAGHFKSTQASVPTVTVTANAGTGSTCTLSNGTDTAGKIEIVTGTLGVVTGSYCDLTFNKAFTTAPICILTPANSTISTAVYVTSSTTVMNINFSLAAIVLSTYDINYHCIETQ